MPWHLTVHTEPYIIEVCYSGIVTDDALLESIFSTIACIKEQQIFLLLADCSMLQGGHSAADLKNLAAVLNSGNIDFTFKEAILVPAHRDASNIVYFWSFLTQANGLQVKPFESRQHALEWLLDPHS